MLICVCACVQSLKKNLALLNTGYNFSPSPSSSPLSSSFCGAEDLHVLSKLPIISKYPATELHPQSYNFIIVLLVDLYNLSVKQLSIGCMQTLGWDVSIQNSSLPAQIIADSQDQ